MVKTIGKLLFLLPYTFLPFYVYGQTMKTDYINCSKGEIDEIKTAHRQAQNTLPRLILEIENYNFNHPKIMPYKKAYPSYLRRAKEQMAIAAKTLECAYQQSYTLKTFTCVGPDHHRPGDLAYTLHSKVLGFLEFNKPGIHVTGNFFHLVNSTYRVQTIMHELTHKCGSRDGKTYFYEQKTAPGPEIKIPRAWGKLAPVYDWWFRYGVCIPAINC